MNAEHIPSKIHESSFNNKQIISKLISSLEKLVRSRYSYVRTVLNVNQCYWRGPDVALTSTVDTVLPLARELA